MSDGGRFESKQEDSQEPNVVWNTSALDQQVGRNAALQARLLTKFLSRAKLQVAELVDAATNGRPSEVAQIAHQLKASSRSVGAMQLGETCQLAETAGTAGNVEDCKTLALTINERFVKVASVIQESLV